MQFDWPVKRLEKPQVMLLVCRANSTWCFGSVLSPRHGARPRRSRSSSCWLTAAFYTQAQVPRPRLLVLAFLSNFSLGISPRPHPSKSHCFLHSYLQMYFCTFLNFFCTDFTFLIYFKAANSFFYVFGLAIQWFLHKFLSKLTFLIFWHYVYFC